ncbi:NADP-dependent malic enzyme, chloroplastic [Labeo rohita]|uniref:NADP-dependent malic enzyme, chloroplastic n=1 Tax=Labeo rohita TaxID=84645 RepID=A0ABQ8L3K9_LABRO|nr:NADP-dependent malic enzyme, chloroplastic [Labeo rohita]
MCLGEEHAGDVLDGAICVHCERFSMRSLRSRLSLFSRKKGQPSAPRGSGPAAAEARRKLKSWGSQVDLADELKKGLSLSRSSVTDESELRDDDAISLTSSDPGASALLASDHEDQDMVDEGEEAEAEPSQTSCPAYAELLEVMESGVVSMSATFPTIVPPLKRAFHFFPISIRRSRRHGKTRSPLTLIDFKHTSYANIEGMRENGYERMPPVEEMLACYLSSGQTSSLKAPSLPSKLLQDTSHLNGKAYAAAGQAVASLHTMAVLQAYQADLLKDLDDGQGLSPDQVAELRRTTDLALRATKQAATVMGRIMAAVVILGGKRKEMGFLLDAPVLPSEHFGTSVETVVERFREAKARSAAFKTLIRRKTRSEPKQQKGPGPSRSEDRRRAQKTSVVTRAPPPPSGGSGRWCESKGGRQDLREVIQGRDLFFPSPLLISVMAWLTGDPVRMAVLNSGPLDYAACSWLLRKPPGKTSASTGCRFEELPGQDALPRFRPEGQFLFWLSNIHYLITTSRVWVSLAEALRDPTGSHPYRASCFWGSHPVAIPCIMPFGPLSESPLRGAGLTTLPKGPHQNFTRLLPPDGLPAISLVLTTSLSRGDFKRSFVALA